MNYRTLNVKQPDVASGVRPETKPLKTAVGLCLPSTCYNCWFPTPQLWICQVFLACVVMFLTAQALEHSFSYVVKPQVHLRLSPTQWVISVDCLLLATGHSTNARRVHYRLPFSVVLERNLDLVRAVKKSWNICEKCKLHPWRSVNYLLR